MCPYHGWMYDLDGRLIAARSMAEDFNKDDWGLNPVSLETLGGFLLALDLWVVFEGLRALVPEGVRASPSSDAAP